MSYREVSEIRDGMRIDWDMPIKMNDGLVLRCDIYRPVKQGRYPVILTYGPYGKWLHFADLYKEQWDRMCEEHPDVPTGSTNKYQQWEVVDPEKWVPDGYVCIRVDSRGAGRSPGVIDIWSLREAQDLAQCVEWAGVQPGRTARSASTASPITPRTSGSARRCSPSISPRSACGRAPPTSIATWRTTAASSAPSRRTGRPRRSSPCNTAAARAASRAA